MGNTPNPSNGNSRWGVAAPMVQPPKSKPLSALATPQAYPKAQKTGPAIKRPWGAVNR